jgi:hypothetical protein
MEARGLALPQDPDPIRPVRLVVSGEIAFDLKKMQKVTANLLGRLGCPACHSGFDIRFIQALDFVVNPKTLEVNDMLERSFTR